MILSTVQLVDELRAVGVKQVWEPRDDRVFVPTDAWLQKFGVYMAQNNPRGQKSQRDCEDFTIRAVDRATDALCEAGLLEDCGHAIGIASIGISPFGPGLLGIPGGRRKTLQQHRSDGNRPQILRTAKRHVYVGR